MRVYRDLIVSAARKEPRVDVYCPQDASSAHPKPVVLFVHGGGWHIGRKEGAEAPCRAWAEQGFLTVATSYRLSGLDRGQMGSMLTLIAVFMSLGLTLASDMNQFVLTLACLTTLVAVLLWTLSCWPIESPGQHPDHVRDVAKAVRWIVDYAPLYGGDPRSIVVVGHSAGGHLAALLCTNRRFLDAEGVPLETVAGCIAISGVYSDHRLQESSVGRQLLHNAFGFRDQYYDSFPIYHVRPDTPPFFLLNGGLDIFLKRHSLDFFYTLRQNRVYAQIKYYPERNHWNIVRGWPGSNILADMTEFARLCVRYQPKRAKTTSFL